jgi:pimeloyl-ACP methyl ester carboxylesterase
MAHVIRVNGLELNVLEWSPPRNAHANRVLGQVGARVPRAGASHEATAILLHGFLDAGASWDRVAPALADAGLRVFAPDLRGFGDSAHVPAGAYYHFPDYVFDLADLVDAVQASPLFLVGHSMGGTIATYYAGAFPEKVKKLALLEGTGPVDNPPDMAPVRMRRWIDDVRALRARGTRARTAGTHEDALRRLAAGHPRVDHAVLEGRLKSLVRKGERDDLVWRNDDLHKTVAPVPFFASVYRAFAGKIACPTLWVSGGAEGMHTPDEEERLASIAELTRVEIAGAGHMMHWTKPKEVAEALVAFWRLNPPTD